MGLELNLLWLFVSAFAAATLLPGGSEVVLAAMVAKGQWSGMLLLLIATLGNTWGSMTNWWLGQRLRRGKAPHDFHKPSQQRALAWLTRFGMPGLLLAWVPLVGDGLCLLAGWLNMPFWRCVGLIALSKGLRYSVVLHLTGLALEWW
ncbi:MAG: YqaA family protein [Aeromonas sp.]